ncbi:MAG: DUF1475 family protein [Opitutaceae bacterium]
MIILLRGIFVVILVSMLGATTWASYQCPLFAVPRDVARHPWFIATLLDAYCGFFTFFVWVCWKQVSWLARVAWFVAIALLGNIAMAAYCLAELFGSAGAREAAELFVGRREGGGGLGLILAAFGFIVVGGAWTSR